MCGYDLHFLLDIIFLTISPSFYPLVEDPYMQVWCYIRMYDCQSVSCAANHCSVAFTHKPASHTNKMFSGEDSVC